MLWTEWDRTDLALERAAMVQDRVGQVPGIQSTEEQINGISLTRVQVMTPQAASQVGKPPGRYFTLECPELKYRNRTLLKNVAGIIAEDLQNYPASQDKGMCLLLALETGKQPLTLLAQEWFPNLWLHAIYGNIFPGTLATVYILLQQYHPGYWG